MSKLETEREMNALTIMPLPVRIPASWYDLLPKVLPLINGAAEQTNAEDTNEIFLKRWRQALIRREGSFVWLHLGGVACYEVVPSFVKSTKDKIISLDREIKEKNGTKAVIQHWRTSIEDLKNLDDEAVVKARTDILRLLHPHIWHDGLGRAWNFAAERANMNFCKIRPLIQRWIAKYENRCNLDKPFSGRLTGDRIPLTGIVAARP